jgi:hypothetical protein
MKKILSRALPFFFMFALAAGSVILSCATGPSARASSRDAEISLNTASAIDGELYTTWVFGSIESVVIVDDGDRSRKIELARDEWQYDPATTRLTIARDLPFKDYFAHIEGVQSIPRSFVLNGISDVTDLMVVIGDRLAIEGYDYAFDEADSRLTFRDDVNLKATDWSIQYSTPRGGTLIGEWKPENDDRMAYLEAEHRKRWLDSWYDRQTAFWFLDETTRDEWKGHPARPPALVRRAATARELIDMKSIPVNVMKFRSGAKDRDLSREVGFDARVPGKLTTDSPRAEFPLSWKTIEEYSRNGILGRKLNVVYEDGSGNGLDQYVVRISMETVDGVTAVTNEPGDDRWLIGEESVDLGVSARVSRRWGLESADYNAKPSVVCFSTWTWSEGPIRVLATADSANDARTEALLRQFIAARGRLR